MGDAMATAVRKTAGIGKGTPGPGRPKNQPNKATIDARKAIAMFVDSNADRLTGWLDEVANGVMNPDSPEFAVSPNPAKAFELFQSVIEYHVPKLARTVVSGDPDAPLQFQQVTRKIVDPRGP